MAIKGKRKAPKRGRPAAVARPRPVASTRAGAAGGRREPFYRTFRGQLTAIVVVLALVGAGLWFFSQRRAESERASQRQDALAAYSEEIRAVLGEAGEAVREIAGAPGEWAFDAVHDGTLRKASRTWIETFQGAGAKVNAASAPEGLAPAGTVLAQAFETYSSAARAYRLAATHGGDSRSERHERNEITQGVLDRAVEQREAASALVAAALALIEDARAGAGMDPARIQPPGSLPPIEMVPSEPEDVSGGKGNKTKTKSKEEGDE